MTEPRLINQMRIIFYIAIFTTLLTGCSAGKPGPEEKIGMHFDAVLEFVVEYPIAWQKDRRLPFGSSNGEVRWTHPKHPGVLLKILSSVNGEKDLGKDGAFDMMTDEYPRIELTLVEDFDLQETTAKHVEGQVRQLHVQAYILSINNRIYVIILEKPIESSDDFASLMDEFVHSFKAIPAR